MLSSQFIKILEWCKKNNVSLSHNEMAILCNLNKEFVENVFKIYRDCDKYNKSAFLEIMMNEEYIINHNYLKILDIISDLNSTYTDELMSILKKPGITRLPSFFDYLNIYYYLTTRPEFTLKNPMKEAIVNLLPDAEEVYNTPNTPEVLRLNLKIVLLERIEEEYEYFVENKDVIFFEDDAEEFTGDLNRFFDLRSKTKKYNANRLIRTIKPENMPKKDNIIKFEKKED